MFKKILRLFRKDDPPFRTELQQEEAERWHEDKSRLMESILGKEHNMVMHAIIPYAVGGGLDLYYYPNDIEGVAVATKELSESPDKGSSNDAFNLYEIAMFTRSKFDLDKAHDDSTEFGRAHANINSVLNVIAPYSAQARLNPNETCEFPETMKRVGGKCFIFDAYRVERATDQFGVLAVIEIFRSEMDFARESGGATLIEKLKQTGHYPYSDLDREPVA